MSDQLRSENECQRKWYSRGYVPHFDCGPVPQLVTFRLIDSFPKDCLDAWAVELVAMRPAEAECERRRRIEMYLDKGVGAAWLSRPDIAEIIVQALVCFNGDRYQLQGWVVMPNHVHVLLTPRSGEGLAQIVHSWKSYTANKANKAIGRTGSFWQREFFDRFVRNEEHLEAAIRYIEYNPVKAGLCRVPAEWRYSSASREPGP
jgi:REP element-mobilizing transposase RayT